MRLKINAIILKNDGYLFIKMFLSCIGKNYFSETSPLLLFCGATRENRNEPFYWRRGDKAISIFNPRRDIKVDNEPENGLNCVLVYLKNRNELGYKYGSCHEDHYYMCSSRSNGKFFSRIKVFLNSVFCLRFKKVHYKKKVIGFRNKPDLFLIH